MSIFSIHSGKKYSVYLSLDTPKSIPQIISKQPLLPFKGIDFYPIPNSYSDYQAFRSLQGLLSIKAINWISVRFFLEQNDLRSTDIHYDPQQNISLARIIALIHRAGKHVCLEVDFTFTQPNCYVANLNPESVSQWFESYKKALTYYAIFAEKNKVELLSIGNEMYSMFPYNKYWLQVISQTRRLYSGIITAKLNCWWQDKDFNQILSWNWLNKLDYIGFSPYFDLATKNNDSLSELENDWVNSRWRINIPVELEQIANHFQKKIIFLEIGYRSLDGTTIEPWNGDPKVPKTGKGTGLYDPQEQSLAIQALFNVFRRKKWWAGVFWFYWPTGNLANNDKSWSIRNKPGQWIIVNNFNSWSP